MQKYFISKEEYASLEISGDAYYHLSRVMRARIGQQLTVCDEEEEMLVVIKDIDSEKIYLEKIETKTGKSELPVFVTLIQGYPKSDKLETIINNAVQFGVSEILPVQTKFSIAKIVPEKIEKRYVRQNKIAKQAAEQSGRLIIPEVLRPTLLQKIDLSVYDKVIVCYEETAKNGELTALKETLSSLEDNQKLAVIVGPEGGLSPEEVEKLKSQGAVICGLGPRILRTENAILYVLSALSFAKELKYV